jgi:hypothetical protein
MRVLDLDGELKRAERVEDPADCLQRLDLTAVGDVQPQVDVAVRVDPPLGVGPLQPRRQHEIACFQAGYQGPDEFLPRG